MSTIVNLGQQCERLRPDQEIPFRDGGRQDLGYLVEHKTGLTVCWIRKCGCTLLKNMFFRLNSGDLYPQPLAIHNDKHAVRQIRWSHGRFGPRDLSKSFIVIRNPEARFLSFYWDKIYSRSQYAITRTRNTLQRRAKIKAPSFAGFDRAADLSLDGHIANAFAVLDGIEVTFSNLEHYDFDMHYMPQAMAIASNNASQLTKVKLEDLRYGTPEFIAEASPDFDKVLRIIPNVNESKKSFSNKEMLTDEMRARIRELYPDDFGPYEV